MHTGVGLTFDATSFAINCPLPSVRIKTVTAKNMKVTFAKLNCNEIILAYL